MAKGLPSLKGRKKGTLRRALRRTLSKAFGKSPSVKGGSANISSAAAEQPKLVAAAVEQQNIQTGLLQQLETKIGSGATRTSAATPAANPPPATQQRNANNAAAAATAAVVGSMASRTANTQQPARQQERVDNAPLNYELDEIKFEAEKIIFKGLSLPGGSAQSNQPFEPSVSSSNQSTPNASAPAPSQPSATPVSRSSAAASGGMMTPMVATFGAPSRAPDAAARVNAPTPTAAGTAGPAQGAAGAAATQIPPVGDGVARILATIRAKESGGNYQARASGSSASGAYQFIDSTWRSLTRKYNVGTEYTSAGSAPPAIQDAVAGKYIEEILRQNNNDVSKVPLVWYTGNPQGRMSEAALRANRGLTAEMYQSRWMAAYNGTQAPAAATQVASAPAQAPALARASTERVVADNAQAQNNQRVVQAMNAPPPSSDKTSQNQLAAAEQTQPQGEISLRNRLLKAFNQQLTAQAS